MNNYFLKIEKDGVLIDLLIYQIPSDWTPEDFESVIDHNMMIANSLEDFKRYMLEDGHKLAPQMQKKYFNYN